jgi:signal transduction histidine kinase
VEETNRLNRIITDFLSYAKPNPPNKILCRINEILEKNIHFLNPQIESQGYTITISIPDNFPELMVDPSLMYQVFLNILINSMQAMPSGGEIQVELETKDEQALIIFKDKGPGIAEELMQKIWDPFFTTKETGTGLGLGIVRNIIEAHNGQVRIENRPVYGVRVIIRLPIHRK